MKPPLKKATRRWCTTWKCFTVRLKHRLSLTTTMVHAPILNDRTALTFANGSLPPGPTELDLLLTLKYRNIKTGVILAVAPRLILILFSFFFNLIYSCQRSFDYHFIEGSGIADRRAGFQSLRHAGGSL